ncbi:sodium-dependent transporter [Lysinibacillus fusiformis]|uniref:sodium-dependent transporter n=1 Tax=Lysinibacillus fusiformis TaxID=28031 RepID=UPI0000F37C61|nr:sodium-dependent transporter [Lysinibacillus fusiformis]EAZ87245.1 sodium-dependent transporter [Bacillus sp. B14905]MED4078222.1 sodium-dependent transporter [Lysinibacillus fusiformis]
MSGKKGQWSSKLGFILASAGAAIGLGAIWKLPYVTGQSGGGAFFLIFVLFTLLIGLPMLLSEYILGRGTQSEAITAYKKIAPTKKGWAWIGRMGVLGCFLLLTFYSVVGGWIFIYSGLGVAGAVIDPAIDPGELFGKVIGTPWITIVGLALFTLANVLVISLGVQNGIEKANKWMMPLLFIMFIVLVIRAVTLDGAMEGVKFFLWPDFSNITGKALLEALGQSFFGLAVGFSCLVTYSSYLKKDVSLPNSAGSVVMLTVLVSFLAGLAIFPVVFAFDLEPAAGPGLLFMVLPTAFSQMPFGEVFLAMFLLLFLFATLTSSFSLYEIIVAAFMENSQKSRLVWTSCLGIVVFLAAIPASLSSSLLADVSVFGKNIFDATDFLVSNLMLPLGNLSIAIFIAYVVDKEFVKRELLMGSQMGQGYYAIYRMLMLIIVPAVILVVFVNMLFQF